MDTCWCERVEEASDADARRQYITVGVAGPRVFEMSWCLFPEGDVRNPAIVEQLRSRMVDFLGIHGVSI